MKRLRVRVNSDAYEEVSAFSVFMGLVLLALPWILPLPVFLRVHADFWSTLMGMLLLSTPLLRHLTSKRFWVGKGVLSIAETGRRRRILRWEGTPSVHLNSHLLAGREHCSVKLVSGGLHLAVHRSSRNPEQCHRLARVLAGTLGAPLLETIDQRKSMSLPEELDLSLGQRLALHPDQVGQEWTRPAHSGVELKGDQAGLTFSWQLSWSQVWPSCLFVAVCICVMAGFPSWDGPGRSLSAYQLSSMQGNHSYFYVCGLLLLLLFFCSHGLRRELRIDKIRLSCRTRLWGVPLWQQSMPASDLQNIWVRPLLSGARIEIVSKSSRLGGHCLQLGVARWVAFRVIQFYAAPVAVVP